MISVSLANALLIYALSGVLSAIFDEIDSKIRSKVVIGSYWFPGVVFGVSFGIMHFQTGPYIIAFSILSGIIYFTAVYCAIKLVDFQFHDIFNMGFEGMSFPNAGIIVGTFGALGLTLILKLFADVKLAGTDIITLSLGGVLGLVFLKGYSRFFENDYGGSFLVRLIRRSSLFVAWQVPVALSLSFSLYFQPASSNPGAFIESIKAFLLGPIVQLIGLIASIISIVSLFPRKKV